VTVDSVEASSPTATAGPSEPWKSSNWIIAGIVVGLVVSFVLLFTTGSRTTVGTLGFVIMLLLMALRVSVAVSMIVAAVAGTAALVGLDPALARLGSDAFQGASSFNLSVIPLFILMGLTLAAAGLGHDVYRAIDAFAWRMRGGMGVATIGASALFGAVSGSAIASTTTMSIVAVPEMRRYHYDEAYAAACAATGGTLGILIPPSAALVLFGVLTEESIGRLLIGGIAPGVMTAVLLMVTAYVLVRINPRLAPTKQEKPSLSKLRAAGLVWSIPVIFGISMGGLYLGYFTPTESGGAGAFLALLYGWLTRRLDWPSLREALSRTIRTSALIFLLVIAGKMFGFFLSVTRIPRAIGDFILALDVAPVAVMTAIFVVYFIAGALMDEIALLVIMTPITYPIAIDLGFSGVWFGVLTIMMLLVGLLAPPVGMLCFVVSGITKIPLFQVYRRVGPFLIPLSIAVGLVILFPGIVTGLPDLMR
jgi:tripartite ATP-independent transporter DctM subunit